VGGRGEGGCNQGRWSTNYEANAARRKAMRRLMRGGVSRGKGSKKERKFTSRGVALLTASVTTPRAKMGKGKVRGGGGITETLIVCETLTAQRKGTWRENRCERIKQGREGGVPESNDTGDCTGGERRVALWAPKTGRKICREGINTIWAAHCRPGAGKKSRTPRSIWIWKKKRFA